MGMLDASTSFCISRYDIKGKCILSSVLAIMTTKASLLRFILRSELLSAVSLIFSTKIAFHNPKEITYIGSNKAKIH